MITDEWGRVLTFAANYGVRGELIDLINITSNFLRRSREEMNGKPYVQLRW